MIIFKKCRIHRKYITLCLVLLLSCFFSETAHAATKYGISSGGKGNWAYHVLNEKKKTVEIRPNKLCAEQKGVSKGSVEIPNTIIGQDGKTTYKVTKIADCAFESCICTKHTKKEKTSDRWKNNGEFDDNVYEGLKKVEIPKNVENIGEDAFCDRDDLSEITFKGNNIEMIADGAFCCTSLSSITIPASCKTIGDYAFSDTELKEINFKGDNITSIGAGAFSYTNLKSIVIPSKIKKIEDNTFEGCEYLSTVTFKGNNVVEIGENAFSESGLSNIIIPSKCKSIGEFAFDETGMTNLTLPASCTNIGKYAFADCDKLKSVTFLQTGSMSVDKLAFSGSPIEKVNIQNYTVYECLIERFDYPSYVMVDSQSTRLFLEHAGKTIWVDVPRGKEVDLSSYVSVPEGKEVFANIIWYCSSMATWYDMGRMSNTLCSYKAEGYPFVKLSTYVNDLNYYVVARYVEKIDSHLQCDTAEYTDKTTDVYYDIQLCYHDKFTLKTFDDIAIAKKKGYKPVGYKIKDKTFQPGAVVSGRSLGVTSYEHIDITIDYHPIQYQIAYDFNGGSGTALANASCTYDKEVALQRNTSYNGGYKFVGWCEDPDGEGTIYKHGDKIKNLTAKDGEVVTLYAVWKDEALLVTFDANGGTVGQGSKKVRYNQQFGNLPTPKREGYKFKGWTMGVNGGTKVTSASVVSYNCDFSLFAQWEAKSYTVTFNANGGEGGGNKEVKYGKSLGNLPKPTRKGYKFIGWYTSKNGGDKITATTKVTGRKTYYAHWEEKGKTLTITVKPKNIKKLSGYQVKYGKKGGKMTTKTYQSATKKSITVKISGVKKGETYVAKARSYRVVKGKKKWSKWKTVTKTVG